MALRRHRAQPADQLPVPARRRPPGLPVAQRHRRPRPRRHRRRRLPAVHRPAAARLGPRRDLLPGLPRPLRPLGGGRRPAAAHLGPARRLGRPGRPPGDGGRQAVRRRPRRHHRAPRPPGRARAQRPLPDAVLPGRVQPPLQRLQLRGGRPAARRRQGPGPALPEVHARGWHLLGRPDHQPLRRHPPLVPPGAGGRGSPEREFFYFPGPQDNTYESWLGHSTLPKFRFSSAELRRRLLDGPGSVAGLAAAPVRAGRLAGRRGQHDRPARHRRLQRRGGQGPAGDHGRGAAELAAGGRALPTTPPATWPATAGTAP